MAYGFCAKCGVALAENARYCHRCGTQVGKTSTQEFTVNAENVTKKIEELIHEGNVTRIIVKDDKGKPLLEIPVTVGVLGVILAPWLAALGVIAALATKCTLVVERREVASAPC